VTLRPPSGSANGGGPTTREPSHGTWLYDLVSGVRASTLSEALPSLPFPSTELMPAVVQEPSAHACTMATLRELRRTLASSAETKATIAERMRLASLHSRIAYLGTKPLSLHMLYTCATYLGISLRMAPELLWIASAALSAQLPAGWREATGADVYAANRKPTSPPHATPLERAWLACPLLTCGLAHLCSCARLATAWFRACPSTSTRAWVTPCTSTPRIATGAALPCSCSRIETSLDAHRPPTLIGPRLEAAPTAQASGVILFVMVVREWCLVSWRA
jgi:hypothetical protein